MSYEDYDWRQDREYLALFGPEKNDHREAGPSWKINVKGLPKGASMPIMEVPASRLQRLIDPSTGAFFDEMCFDDWLFTLKKIEILHPSRTVNIHVIAENPGD